MTDKFYVTHSDGREELFKPSVIGTTIIEETGINEDLANRIQNRIARKIYKMRKDGLKSISTSAIRAEVSAHLLQEREFDAEERNRKLGMSVAEFEYLTEHGCKDNANIDYSPEMVAKYSYDSIAKGYALVKMPAECANALPELKEVKKDHFVACRLFDK